MAEVTFRKEVHLSQFHIKHGIIPACDVSDLDALISLVKQTCSLKFIQGYKLGIEIVVPDGVKRVVQEIRRITDLPLIYDHQKYGNDIPDVSGGNFLARIKEAGIDALIIFPFAGINTLKATIEACKRLDLLPIVGGEMTHPGFLASEGGYLADDAPTRIYKDAARHGVDTFVVPGNKVEKIKHYVGLIRETLPNPAFVFPGIGKGQGGDIAEAFEASKPCVSSAIVGRGIYAAEDIREAASILWEKASSVL